MGADKKTRSTATAAVAKVEAETQDEIEEIMNEIQTLQQGMKSKAKSPPSPKLKVVPPVPAPASEPEPQPEPEPEASSEPMQAEAAGASPEEEDHMEGFRGDSSEASLEETLGGMKEEAPASGKSLLDTPMEEAPEMVEEAPAEDHAPAHAHPPPPHPPKRVPVAHAHGGSEASAEGNLTLTLSGSMTLKLRYEFDGQDVVVGFSDHCLRVQLSDGTEFKIPVARSVRKAA